MRCVRSFLCSYRLDTLPLNVGETMSDDGRYATQIAVVKEECKDADEAEIIKEFKRYEEEFLIPPEDALRSVIRKFQIAAGQEVSTISSRSRPAIAERKVTKFSELKDDDKNVTIEVAVVSYIPKIQNVRGEERQIAYGWVEDSPWEGERERWDFTDWGDHSQNLTPGSVVRLEGVSVNFWNDRRSININRPSRVTVLKEGGQPVTKISDEPVPPSEGGYQQDVVELAAQRTTELTGIDLTTKPLISLRLNSGSLDAVVLPQILKVLPTTGQDYIITLVRNPTLTGASWNTSTFTNVDYDVSATAMTGGDIMQVDYITNTVQAGSGIDAATGYKWSLQLGRTIGGTSDIMTIGIRTAVSGTPAGSALGSLIFYDLTNGV